MTHLLSLLILRTGKVGQPEYMLDTNILSAIIKQPAGAVTDKIREVGHDTLCTSIIVASELRYGAIKKNATKLSRKVEELLAELLILPVDHDADRHYADIRCQLEREGKPIGANDMLIAAHARSLGLVFVTDNSSEFSRVDDLRIQNWLN